MGEKDYPINGQSFLKYSGRWGEIGSLPLTTATDGPRGPAYQTSKWNFGRASSGGGGGGGGGGCGGDEEPHSPTDLLEPC